MRIDLHTHSTVSDGTDAPAGLVRKAAEQGLDVLGLTDHDTFDGLSEAHRAASAAGVELLAGVEISTQVNGHSVHLLGYGCDPDEPALRDELARIRRGRAGRIPAMVERLNALGLPLTVEEVVAFAGASPSVGRPHVADALVARGYVAHRNDAFAVWLHDGGPAYVERYTPRLEDAIALVRGAGGVAVLAHPWARGGADDLTEPFLELLVAEHGLDGLEVDHPDHEPESRAALRTVARRLGLLLTGSSDHHGLGKTRNDLGCDTTEPDVYRELVRRVGERGGRP